jgi:hypothetical protein
MPTTQVMEKLALRAAYEVDRATAHPGRVENTVLVPNLAGAVVFEPSSDLPDIYYFLPPHGGRRVARGKMDAQQQLLRSWESNLFDRERTNPALYADIVRTISMVRIIYDGSDHASQGLDRGSASPPESSASSSYRQDRWVSTWKWTAVWFVLVGPLSWIALGGLVAVVDHNAPVWILSWIIWAVWPIGTLVVILRGVATLPPKEQAGIP